MQRPARWPTTGWRPTGQASSTGVDRTQWALEKLVFGLKGPKDDDPSPDARRDWYLRRTRGKKILIVLDNVDETALIENLLPAGSACAVVVTARERPFKLEFGKSVLVPPLTSEHATELLDLLLGGGRVGRERKDASRPVLATARVPVAIHMVAAILAVRCNWTLDVAVRGWTIISARAVTPGAHRSSESSGSPTNCSPMMNEARLLPLGSFTRNGSNRGC